MPTEPYFTGPTTGQRLYKFANGHGASVVPQADGIHHEMAVIRPTDKMSFWLNYKTPFGPPKDGLTEDEVQKHLAAIEAFEPTEPTQGEKS